ncbi:uncharacterized protein LOC124274612 [Haliotis rubra]|uniref:uncharacterized protein LOC124274612 n=1 Tax=Haliotis rubra TaxID=36100 RepID=UPI001EE5932B|nr:uncharacterized protein LOC124274612 [Haliotis rubra]
MATGGDAVESIPVSPGKEYHFCILYNYDSDPPDDIEKSLKVVKKITTTLASIGLRASYYYDRDCLPGLNVFQELFRVVEASEYIIVVLTPGFILDSWNRYTQQATFKELLERGISHRLLPLCFGLNQNLRVPVELTTQAPLEFSDDWENDEASWQKLRRVFTKHRPIANVSMHATNQGNTLWKKPTKMEASKLKTMIPQPLYIIRSSHRMKMSWLTGCLKEVLQQMERRSSTHGCPLTDYDEHQVQGLDGGTGRETEEPLQGTSLVPDGEDQVQDGVTGEKQKSHFKEQAPSMMERIRFKMALQGEKQKSHFKEQAPSMMERIRFKMAVQGEKQKSHFKEQAPSMMERIRFKMALQERNRRATLQGTSPVYDGEDQVQDGVTGRETEEPFKEQAPSMMERIRFKMAVQERNRRATSRNKPRL